MHSSFIRRIAFVVWPAFDDLSTFTWKESAIYRQGTIFAFKAKINVENEYSKIYIKWQIGILDLEWNILNFHQFVGKNYYCYKINEKHKINYNYI